MSKIKNHPSTIEFGEIECCALKSAIKNVNHHGFISVFIEEANKKEPRHSWAIIHEIFTMDVTVRLVFIPGEIHKEFYLNVARLEKKELTEGGKIANCGHAIGAHIEALNNICFLTMYPAGNN